MSVFGKKLSAKRKDLGLTQSEFAEKMNVTRQTVSRWEAGTVMPDIERLGEIADVLGVSCDYLLRDGAPEETPSLSVGVSRLLMEAAGSLVRLSFFDEEADIDLFDKACRILAFEGNWMKVEAVTKKGSIQKLIPLSSVLSMEFLKEER